MNKPKWSDLGRDFRCPECGVDSRKRFLEQRVCLECMYIELELFACQQQLERTVKPLI